MVGSLVSLIPLLCTAALRFQPTKRPQVSTQKAKAKPNLPKATASVAAALSAQVNANASESAISNISRAAAPKTTFADWTAQGDDDDVNGFYDGGDRRQRGGRKKRKKNKEETQIPQNWDDIYDPSRPNNYEEYKNSDEKIREIREWKDRLYAHRIAKRKSDYSDSSEDDARYRPQMNSMPLAQMGCRILTVCRKLCSTTINVFCASSRALCTSRGS